MKETTIRLSAEAIESALTHDSRRPRGAALSTERTLELKWLFMNVARKVCPGFVVTEQNRRVVADVFDWCVMAPGSRLDPEKGLWLWGNIGTGKSTMLRIVRDFCRYVRPYDGIGPYSFRISDAKEVAGEFMSEGFKGIETFIMSRRQAFDELGAESLASHYGTPLNVMEHVLLRRYDRRHDAFTHVTTNLSIQQLRQHYGERVYDRCFEMFNFVEMPGRSWRQKPQCREGSEEPNAVLTGQRWK